MRNVCFLYFKKLIVSDDREKLVGKEGLRAIGVFLRDSLTSASLMVVKGNLLLASGCMQSSSKSCTTQVNTVNIVCIDNTSMHSHAVP